MQGTESRNRSARLRSRRRDVINPPHQENATFSFGPVPDTQ